MSGPCSSGPRARPAAGRGGVPAGQRPGFGETTGEGQVRLLWRRDPGVDPELIMAPADSVSQVSPSLAMLADLAAVIQDRRRSAGHD